MANDDKQQGSGDTDAGHKHAGQPDKKRVIGEGMTSLDSTQVPLKAETGLPDYDAINGRVPKGDSDDESSGKR